MEIEILGSQLRHQRLAAGRTIASVAADAGLSVPYIANLENGRGNPTLSAVNRLAAALGVRLGLDIAEGDQPATPALPGVLEKFSHSARFVAETTRLAQATGAEEALARRRLLHAMAAMGALTGTPLSELDCHRILDTAALITHLSKGQRVT